MSTIIYLLQVTACTAVFYLFYFLFLSRLTFFTTNRWYLLATVLLSFLIPVLRVTLSEQQPYVAAVQHIIYVPEATAQDVPTVIQQAPVAAEPIHWDVVLRMVYFAMAAALGVHLLVTLLSFLKHIKGKRIAKIGKVNVLSGQQKIANGSFLNYIFLNDEELSADELQQIIAHEMLHIKLCHSADRILVKIAQIVLWFNPFIYLYARSVEENHEFEVDREIARSNDKHNYANLLLHLSVAGQGMLYHNFSKVPLKKRIGMLFNKPSNKMKKIIYVLIVPVVLVSCLAFARLKKADVPVTKKEHAIPKVQYYTRLHLKKEDGTYYDKILVTMPGGGKATASIPSAGKPAFMIDWKLYNEADFKKILPSVISSFKGNYGTSLDVKIKGEDIKGYDVFFLFYTKKAETTNIDTSRKPVYQQRIKRTAEEAIRYKKQQEEFNKYQQTADYKNKMKLTDEISGKIINVTVKGTILNKIFNNKRRAILADYNGHEFAIDSRFGQGKSLVNMVKPGDRVTLKVFESAVRIDYPVLIIPAYVIKNKVKIFQLAEAGKIPDYPFLYESNKVRFAEGQVSNIVKYPDGKWKSALFETVNGYKFNLSFKQSAPDLNSIEDGDHVRLRFVHEVKTGVKTYRINDWVSITTNIKDYGIKNPELFNKYYIEVKQAVVPPKYSVVGDLSKLGKSPLVTIDDKVYNKDILYTISPSCIKGVGIFRPSSDIIKHGVVIKDGYVEIKTKAGKITYLTPLEKENIVKEYSIPKNQYFTRLHLKQADGTYLDKIIVSLPSGGETGRTLSPADKVGFIIDKKLYSEEEFKKILPSVIASFTGGYGTGGAQDQYLNHGVDASAYNVIFSFNTKNAQTNPNNKRSVLDEKIRDQIEKDRGVELKQGNVNGALKPTTDDGRKQVNAYRKSVGYDANATSPIGQAAGGVSTKYRDSTAKTFDEYSKKVGYSNVTQIGGQTSGARSFRNDTIEFATSRYKLSENATLNQLLNMLPNLKVGDNGSVFYRGEPVTRLTINTKEYNGGIEAAVKSIPADIVNTVQIAYSTNSESIKTLNIITKQNNNIEKHTVIRPQPEIQKMLNQYLKNLENQSQGILEQLKKGADSLKRTGIYPG